MPIRVFLIAGGVFMLVYFGWLVHMARAARRTRRLYRRALNEERGKRDQVWLEADSIRGMVSLYITMVSKHGPDSEEAKAFRFQMDSGTMKELHGDNAAIQAFQQQADIIDQTYRRIHARGTGKVRMS